MSNPTPLFLIHNTKQITCVLFSNNNNNRFYAGNRDGEFFIYDLETRRHIFKTNLSNSLTNIVEISDDSVVLAYCRDGSLFKICQNMDLNEWICAI